MLRHHLAQPVELSGHVAHLPRHLEVVPHAEILSDERHLAGVVATAVLDLHRVARIDRMSELDQLHSRPGVLIVLRLRAGEGSAVEARNHVTGLEARLLGW